MLATDLSPDTLDEALARAAAGVYPHEAAVRLLVEHGTWPARLADAGLVDLDPEVATFGDEEAERVASNQRHQWPHAWVDWPAAVAALDAGTLHASGSEARVLRIAASLSGSVAFDVADSVAGLNRATLALVFAALSHANGAHAHREHVPSSGRPPAGSRSSRWARRGGSRGPVCAWPKRR